MSQTFRQNCRWLVFLAPFLSVALAWAQDPNSQVGREVAIPSHLQDGEEFNTPVSQLIRYGAQLFDAKFTIQEGAGRPLSKGTGAPVSDPTSPLVFPRNSTASPRPKQTPVRVVTMRPSQVLAAIA
jgi:hypothetical protein